MPVQESQKEQKVSILYIEMRKRVGIIKRASALLLVILMSINSFAAIVSDNDGSAFITKSEFDALKSSFQSQIDSYNNSIDSKIDGAIAAYLSGIKLSKTTNELFFNGKGDGIVIVDGKRNKLLKIPYGFFDWFESDGKITKDVSAISQHCAGSVRIYRVAPADCRNGEIFWLDDGSFSFFSNDWNYSLNINLTYVRKQDSSTNYPPTGAPNLHLRWQGYHTGTKTTAVSDIAPGSDSHLHNFTRKPSSLGFIAWSTSGFWADAWNTMNTGECVASHSASASVRESTKILWYLDSNTSTTPTKPFYLNNNTASSNFLLNNLDTGNCDGWDCSGNEWTVSYPDQHKIKLDVLFCVNSGGTSDRTVGYYDHGDWVGDGKWNSAPSATRPDVPTMANKWEEPLQKLSAIEQKTIKNRNFDTSMLSDYSVYGFGGFVHQGLPLYLFGKDGNVEFELNTTGIGGTVIFALKTSPFDCTTTAIHNTPLTTGISNLKLDGAAVTGGDMTLSQGVHKISFDVTGASSTNKVPVFFMFGYPSSLTETPRYVVTLPSTFQFTSID